MFKVAIIGGEAMGDYPRFKKKCMECLKNKVKEDSIMIYTVGDRYVDAFAERYGIDTRFFGCDFKHHGRNALKERAEALLEDCNAVIIFENGLKDTQMIKKMAAEKGLPLRVIMPSLFT